MEFIKVGILAFILFYFTWLQIFYMMIFVGAFYYYLKNKINLLENQTFFNVFMFYFITFYELSYYYISIGYNKFSKTFIGKYIHNYLEQVNEKYLILRESLIEKIYSFTIQTVIKTMMKLEKEEKNISQNKLSFKPNQTSEILESKLKKNTKEFNIDEFLNELEK
jgi:hypothetical protein